MYTFYGFSKTAIRFAAINETIVRTTSGESEVMDEILRYYNKRIRIAAIENGHIDRDTEDSIKQRLVAVLFQFCFDERLYPKIE